MTEPPSNPFKPGHALKRSPEVVKNDEPLVTVTDTPLARPLPDEETDAEAGEFTLVTGQRSGRKRVRTSPNASSDAIKRRQLELAVATNQVDRFALMKHTLYVKGNECNLVQIVKSSAKAFEQSLNEQCGTAADRLTVPSGVSSLTDQQYLNILNVTEIAGH